MTLQIRRRTYWILFSISLALSLLGLLCAVLLFLRKNLAVFLIENGIYRLHNFLGIRIPSHALSIADVVALAAFSVIAGAYILKSFRKTVSPEIFFFSFWVACSSFESLRLFHFLLALSGWTDSSLAIIDKLYTGIKFFGFTALFISGLYATGMRSEKHFSIIATCAGISTALATVLPVNSGIWDSNLMFRIGYSRLIQGFSFSIILITITNYIIATRVRGDTGYYKIALGIAASAAGTFFLGKDISPVASLISLFALALGSTVFIHKLHSYYLWQ